MPHNRPPTPVTHSAETNDTCTRISFGFSRNRSMMDEILFMSNSYFQHYYITFHLGMVFLFDCTLLFWLRVFDAFFFQKRRERFFVVVHRDDHVRFELHPERRCP